MNDHNLAQKLMYLKMKVKNMMLGQYLIVRVNPNVKVRILRF